MQAALQGAGGSAEGKKVWRRQMIGGKCMCESPFLVDIADGSAVLTLNRPKSLNALSGELRRKLINKLAVLDRDENVRAAILTGAGRAFCAGIDLKEIGNSRADV